MSQKRKYNKLHDSDKFATQYIRSRELNVHSSTCYLKNGAFLGCTLLPSISSHRVQTNIYHTADNIIPDVICTTLWTIPHTDLKNILFWLNCIFYCGMWPLQGQIASECFVTPLLVNYWFERMELRLDKQQEVRKGVKVRADFVPCVDIFSVALRSEPRPVRACGCALWLVWGSWAGEAILQDNLKKAQIPVAISQNKLPALQRHHCQQKSS